MPENSSTPTLRDTPFPGWWREAWLLALPLTIGLATRLAATTSVTGVFDGDAANHLLIGRHLIERVGQPDWPPLMFYGQTYVGAFEGWLTAPWQYAMPADPRAMGLVQTMLTLVLILLLYRWVWPFGGRWAALAATLPLACGSPPLLGNAGGRFGSYMTTMITGLTIWMLAAPLFTQRLATPRRWLALGFCCGFGLWNNPQIASFIAPPLWVVLARGEVVALWHTQRWRERLGVWRFPLFLLTTVLGLMIVALLVLAIALRYIPAHLTLHDGAQLSGRWHPTDDGMLHLAIEPGWVIEADSAEIAAIEDSGQHRLLRYRLLRDPLLATVVSRQRHIVRIEVAAAADGTHQRVVVPQQAIASKSMPGTFAIGTTTLSVTRPHRYLIRALGALLALIAMLELVLRIHRLPPWMACLGLLAGMLVGAAPLVAFHLRRDPSEALKNPPVGLHAGLAVQRFARLPGDIVQVLVGPMSRSAAFDQSTWVELGRSVLRGTLLLLALGGGCVLFALWRKSPPGSRLGTCIEWVTIHAIVVITLYLGFPSEALEPRYLLALGIAYASTLTACVAWVARRNKASAVAIMALLLLGHLDASLEQLALQADDARRRPDISSAFLHGCSARGIQHGIANYWVGYPVMFWTNEQLSLVTVPQQLVTSSHRIEPLRRAGRRVWILEPLQAAEDARAQRELLGDHISYRRQRDDRLDSQRIIERWVVGPPAAPRGSSGPYIIYTTQRTP
jgi:hypothetical protein